jgi:hypothetical protein
LGREATKASVRFSPRAAQIGEGLPPTYIPSISCGFERVTRIEEGEQAGLFGLCGPCESAAKPC